MNIHKKSYRENSDLSSTTFYSIESGAGFTIIEILIVLAISSILLTFGTISLLSFRSQQNLDNESKSLVALLTRARNNSLHGDSDSRWGVWITNPLDTPAEYTLFQVDETLIASSTYTNIPGTVFERKIFKGGLNVILPEVNTVTDIVFAKRTGLPNASTSLIIQASNNSGPQKTITVSANGLVDYH